MAMERRKAWSFTLISPLIWCASCLLPHTAGFRQLPTPATLRYSSRISLTTPHEQFKRHGRSGRTKSRRQAVDASALIVEFLDNLRHQLPHTSPEIATSIHNLEPALRAKVSTLGSLLDGQRNAAASALVPILKEAESSMRSYDPAAISSALPDLHVGLEDLPRLPPDTQDAIDLLIHQLQIDLEPLVAFTTKVWGRMDPETRPLLAAPAVLLLVALSDFAWSRIDETEVPLSSSSGSSSAPYTYSHKEAAAFYSSRPLVVAKRLGRLFQLTALFNTKLLLDWQLKRLEETEKLRAQEALVLANQLGPTFIKLGQALSIRTDLIPEAYALELRKLQDAVPPFDSEEAMEVLRRELGVDDLGTVFSSLSTEPVASASIGQVYRGTLLDGRDVAVKVQRPAVLADIVLDLFILRLITPLQVRIQNAVNGLKTFDEDVNTALALVDEWGRGFVAEVDYLLEARNTMEFAETMAKRGLNAVTAPTVIPELSTSKVLVTEWVQGTRLDLDASPDVPRLCGVAINAYLTMLLDTGTLHCDPHPGNLLRTSDGRLCILDWGMTLQVPRDLQYGLLEFIAHVNSEDYEAIPYDFVNLGFTPPEKLEDVKAAGITDGLSFALRQLSLGGGPAKIRERVRDEFVERYGSDLSEEELREKARAEMISRMEDQLRAEGVDVNGVTNVMEEVSRRNRELFKLPPYVLYVSRAFSTLEGIGLSIDENYAIIQECYPYLARRLLTDNSPRAKSALMSMLYGPELPSSAEGATSGQSQGERERRGLLSADKLVEMTSGFTTYTVATSDVDMGSTGMQEARSALTDIVLSQERNVVQDILVDEVAKIVEAILRDRLQPPSSLARDDEASSNIIGSVLQFSRSIPESLPAPLRPLALPLSLPGEVATAVAPLLEKSKEDEAVLKTASVLAEAATQALRADDTGVSGGHSETRLDTVEAIRQQLSNPNSPLWTSILTPENLQPNGEAQKEFREKTLPGILSLTRRLGSTVLERAVHRLDAATLKDIEEGRLSEESTSLLARRMARDLIVPLSGALGDSTPTRDSR